MKGLNVGLEGTHIGVVIFGNSARVVLDFRAYELTTDYEMTIRNAIESIPKPSSGERTFINRGLRMANRFVMRDVYGMRMDVKQVCTFCNILCLSVCRSVCLFVCFLLPLPSIPPPRLSLPSYPYFLFLYLRIHLCFFQVLLLITDGRQTMISSLFEPTAVQVSTAIKARGIKISAIGIGAADPVELWTYASKPEDTLFVNDFSVLCENILETRRLLLGPGK